MEIIVYFLAGVGSGALGSVVGYLSKSRLLGNATTIALIGVIYYVSLPN